MILLLKLVAEKSATTFGDLRDCLVKGIHQLPVVSPKKGLVTRALMFSLILV